MLEEGNIMLARVRRAHKVSQDELAEKLGISRQTLSNYENGNTDISFKDAIRAAKFLECSITELAGSVNV